MIEGKRVCAWCKKVLGDAPFLNPDEVSHGVCDDCAKKLAIQMGMDPDEFVAKMNTDDSPASKGA